VSLVELEPGTLFAGEYRVVRRLGSGGMGAVYVAEQIATGRMRALKTMHASMTYDTLFREKFTLEAKVGARIESEHVVEVIDAGVDEATGTPWLAMELLSGEDLATAVQRLGPFPKERMLAVLGDICHALAAAHASGIVHRDLKPENVFIAEEKRSRRGETAKVLDFGIAKVIADARSENTGTVGSPLWMAPEQTERNAIITPATDVWAIGLIAFYMLTGRVYFRTADAEEKSLHAFLRELILDDLPSASARAKEVGATLPEGFEAWFGKCVTREPRDRHADARAAIMALRTALGEPPESTFTTGPVPVRISKDVPSATQAELLGSARTMVDATAHEESHVPVQGPSPKLLALGGALLAVAVAGGVIALMRMRPTDPQAPVTEDAATPLAVCPRGMVRIAGGDLAMGSEGGLPEERPVHTVHVATLCADATEVTASEYDQCVKKKSCPAPPEGADWPQITKDDRQRWSKYCNYGAKDRGEHPMNCVSFDDAVAYCRYAGKRMPTEQQWELVARGVEGRTYPWGHDAPAAARVNACDRGCAQRGDAQIVGAHLDGDDGWEATSPVATFGQGATPAGVFDLAGNVAEWTDAAFCPYGESACGSSAKVVRGGSWLSDTPVLLRATARAKSSPVTRAPDIGFRCVR
jgi:formylglycine-generating enzyme required for sulfatase activity/tRNA A-37 threonylcarbamoyl transferase component Bud32